MEKYFIHIRRGKHGTFASRPHSPARPHPRAKIIIRQNIIF